METQRANQSYLGGNPWWYAQGSFLSCILLHSVFIGLWKVKTAPCEVRGKSCFLGPKEASQVGAGVRFPWPLDGTFELGLHSPPDDSPRSCRGLVEQILPCLWYCCYCMDVSKATVNLSMKLLAHPQSVTPWPKQFMYMMVRLSETCTFFCLPGGHRELQTAY